MLAAAESRHIVSVCKSLAEADKVGFDSVIMVGAGYIKTEARSYVVEDKNHTVIVAELTNSLPILLGGTAVVVEVAVIVRLSYEACNVAVASVVSVLKSLKIKPRNNNVVCNLFGKYAGVVYFLTPLEVAVIIAL